MHDDTSSGMERVRAAAGAGVECVIWEGAGGHLVGERSKSDVLPACLSGDAKGDEEVEGMPNSSDFKSWLYAPLPSTNSLYMVKPAAVTSLKV